MTTATTFLLPKEIELQMIAASKRLGISKSRIAATLFRMFRDKRIKPLKIFSSVAYQSRRKREEWGLLHVRLRWDEYEQCQDLRKLFKISASGILAFAVEHYLEEIIAGISSDKADIKCDSYPIFYLFSSIFNETFEYYLVAWKKPPPIIAPITL